MRRFRRGSSARIDDSNSSQKILAEERAVLEEERRKEEASRRRSFGKAARNVEVFHQKQSMAISSTPSVASRMQSGSSYNSAPIRSPMQPGSK